jgi:hypothetical protein
VTSNSKLTQRTSQTNPDKSGKNQGNLFLLGCNSEKEPPIDKGRSNLDTLNMETRRAESDSTKRGRDTAGNPMSSFPIHGKMNRELLRKYYPGVTDTIKDLRIVGSEKINLHPAKGIIVSLLHNTGTFDQMILCTHDSSLTLIDSFYIGKATTFDRTSHTIAYEAIGKATLRFDHVDWGYVKKGDQLEIDTLKSESYSIMVSEKGKITPTAPPYAPL